MVGCPHDIKGQCIYVYVTPMNGVTPSEELVKELAKHEPLRVVFRDNGFVSDAVKINVEQIFRQLSPSTEVRAI